ncbi:MAG: ABC transporter ATP-binding protein [Candidatus Caldatribacterium sp.]|nr:ABC transporter ATP-binding protein [Candidatus Caldatribacterium sp.]
MSPLLEVKNLTKVFTLGSLFSRVRITAVDRVSFTIEEGEIFTLAGESGCGKTTTARMILGFETPTGGTIRYRGKDLAEVVDRKAWFREVQAVFQNPFETFNPLRMVEAYFFETVENFGLAKSRKEAEALIDAKLKAVGLSLEEIAGKYPSEFSGGQLQRASIARALLTNPSLLVADEPVSMVDASLRMSIVNLFRKLCDELGVSVLYITHDLATAYYVSDRIAVMFRGNIVEMGKVEEVLGNPRHPYTRLLLSSIPEPNPEKRLEEKVVLLEEREEYLLSGCRFAGRCPEVMEICRQETPEEVVVSGVLVRCHRLRESQKTREERSYERL